MRDFNNEPMTIEVYANLTSEELAAWQAWGELPENEEQYEQFSFEAETECMDLVSDILASETFGDEERESKPERVLRFIIEGLGQDEAVSTAMQLRDYNSYFPEEQQQGERD